jgi:hypothetical protein
MQAIVISLSAPAMRGPFPKQKTSGLALCGEHPEAPQPNVPRPPAAVLIIENAIIHFV